MAEERQDAAAVGTKANILRFAGEVSWTKRKERTTNKMTTIERNNGAVVEMKLQLLQSRALGQVNAVTENVATYA